MYMSCLNVCHEIVNLQGIPAIDDGQDEGKMDDNPVSYWSIHLAIILSKNLAGSSRQSCAFHLYTSWVRMWGLCFICQTPRMMVAPCGITLLLANGKVPSINLSIQLFLCALEELVLVRFLHGLMVVHAVWASGGSECKWINSLLQVLSLES